MKIAYISQFYPHLTETFVYREVLGLRRRGLDIVTYATWPPEREKLSAESLPLVDETSYVFPLKWLRFLGNHLRYLLTRPLRYLGTLWFVVTRRGQSLCNRGFAFLHFCMAIQIGPEMARRGVTHLHAHFTINAATIALVIARLHGISFSFTAHNLLFTKQMVLRDKIREARFIAAISEFTRDYLIEHAAPLDVADKIHVVHCGVRPADFAPRARLTENARAELLFVAQLAERKGAPFLIEACRLLAARGAEFHCTIVGDGPQRLELEAAIAAHGLRECVTLPGAVPQENLGPYLDRADTFVLPCVTTRDGDMDGVPVSLMEAMAKGIPVVSTRVSGIPELVEDGVSGLLVDQRDANQLADAIERLISDAELRRSLGREGREKVTREFDLDRIAEQLEALFRRYAE